MKTLVVHTSRFASWLLCGDENNNHHCYWLKKFIVPRCWKGTNVDCLKWYYDQIFPLDLLGVSHRIPWKNKNAVYCLQISALVVEIFKFENCVKYANEMTDDVIYSTQFSIKSIKIDILVNLQRRPLKLGRLIVLQETHLRLQKILFPWQLSLFQSPPSWFQYVSDFQLAKH